MMKTEVIGRPFGGLAFLWNKKMSSFRVLGSSPNNRVMVALLECDDFVICTFKVYMTCFAQNGDYITY